MRRHPLSSLLQVDASFALPAFLLVAATLASGCNRSPSDTGYTAIQDSPDETYQFSSSEQGEVYLSETISPALIDSPTDAAGVAAIPDPFLAPTPESHPLPTSVVAVKAIPASEILKETRPRNPAAKILDGKTVGVSDGDTVTVLDATNTQHKIRLEAIDAPESHQPFGTKSKQALSDKVFGKTVRVEWTEKDKYRRTLGHIFIDDRWINKEMVEEGWAWHYKQYSDDEDLAKLD